MPFSVQLIVTDVTAAKEAEAELRAHRDRLELLLAERTASLARSHAEQRELEARPVVVVALAVALEAHDDEILVRRRPLT